MGKPKEPRLRLSTAAILSKIAVKRGCLKKGSEPDYDKAAKVLLEEFRSGKLGRITLEAP